MSLLHPTTGQLLDRLSILALKIAHAPDPRHFLDEQVEIERRLGVQTLSAHTQDLQRLAYVNERLWAEQERVWHAARCENAPPNHLGVILFRLNQMRVGIIEEIDTKRGEHVGAEKVYDL